MEVELVQSATAHATIEHLRMIFARFGLPEVMVTDNGTYFTSNEFQEFEQCNSIRHVCIVPYHPLSNGLAERAVQTYQVRPQEATQWHFADKTVTLSFSL